MSIFNLLSLFGGLALFLYGMRLMGDGLKESSSGALKLAMEKVTNNPIKAFLLGLGVTALIQSSTATIVITSGLVAAGILSLHQSLGIIVGANVGTTVTGQIIRLLDLDSGAAGWLQLFQPSSLAPIALIIGILFIMAIKVKNAKSIGNIAIGFGILFTGLMNMTGAVDTLSSNGVFDSMFLQLDKSPVLGYLVGAAVAFVLQSSSATIGILQAFSAAGGLTFRAVYAVIVGVYLGDCVTTAIVCWIGAKAESRRVGIVNVLYNIGKSILVLAAVAILKQTGALDGIWNSIVNSGIIANTNTIFNLVSALILLPTLGILEKMSCRLVPDEPAEESKYDAVIEEMNPVFFSTPALALRGVYSALMTMFYIAEANINAAFDLMSNYDQKVFDEIHKEEENIDMLADAVSNYLVALSGHLYEDSHLLILNEYYKIVTEFERLGDHAMNVAEHASDLAEKNMRLSDEAVHDLNILKELIGEILADTEQAFKRRDLDAAKHIEPLEEVVDDMINDLKTRHMKRLIDKRCNTYAGTKFMDTLTDIERISDTCSDVGLATVTRVSPAIENHLHDYVSDLHAGRDANFNKVYRATHERYATKLYGEEGREKLLGEEDPAEILRAGEHAGI